MVSPFPLISPRLCVSAVNSFFLSGEQIYPGGSALGASSASFASSAVKPFWFRLVQLRPICNPPFSIYTRWINKCIYLSPKKIAFIMGSLNLTTKRIKILEDGGYFLTKMHIVNCRGWFANTLLVVFEKGGDPIISYEPGWF